MTDAPRPSAIQTVKTRQAVWAVVKWCLFGIVAYFVARALVGQFMQITWGDIRLRWSFVVLGMLCALVGRALMVLPYRLVLARAWRAPGWAEMMAIAWIPQIGKYVPGKVASAAGAVWLLHRRKVPATLAVGTVVMLSGLLIVVGLILSAPLALWPPVRAMLPAAWLWCALVVPAAGAALHPSIFGRLMNFVLRRLGRQPIPWPSRLGVYALPAAIMVVQLSLFGLALWSVARALTDLSLAWVPLFVSAFALASTLGFVALFAPAGLGVQEGILLGILGLALGGATVAIVVVAIRLIQTIAEALLAGIGLIVLRCLPDAERRSGRTVKPPAAQGAYPAGKEQPPC